MKKKKRINNSPKRIPIVCLIMFTLEIFTSTLLNCSGVMIKIYLTQNTFSSGFIQKKKRGKYKRDSMTIVK